MAFAPGLHHVATGLPGCGKGAKRGAEAGEGAHSRPFSRDDRGAIVPAVPSPERPVVLLPTYNERENLGPILDAVRVAMPAADVAVIDDASPDGTGALALQRAAQDHHIHVVQRERKEGLGRAYLAGFRWALASDRGYTHVFQMDADFSHDPNRLEALLQACRDGADVAIGSRYVRGGATPGWSRLRRLLSAAGGFYARTLLSMPVRDPTSGFKCLTRAVLEGLALDRIITHGYGFQIELVHRALQGGFQVREVPVVFVDRTRGSSKMSLGIMTEALIAVWRLRGAKGGKEAT